MKIFYGGESNFVRTHGGGRQNVHIATGGGG